MRVGLLQCDHVAEHLQDIGGDYPEMFQNLFPKLEFQVYDLCHQHFPKSVHDCQAYMVTGAKHSVYDDYPWIHELKTFVQQIQLQDKYYIGICFGHQILAEALGGKVQKSEDGWCVGAHSFQLTSNQQWAESDHSHYSLLMSCQDQVQLMPEEGDILAHSPDCPVGMFKVGDRMMGIQAHPEFPKAFSRAIMQERKDTIGVEKVSDGLLSLSSNLNANEFASSVMRFLDQDESNC